MNDNEIKKGNAVNKDTKGVTTTAFFAKATSVSFTQTSTTKVVEIVSDSSSWTCSSNKSWCTVTKAAVNSANANELIDGQPMGAIKIKASSNTTGSARSATVTISRSGFTNISISVSQAATGAPTVDRSGSIFYVHQTKSDNCAGACCCMLAKRAMCSISHSLTDSAQWGDIAQLVGKTSSGLITISGGDAMPIYNQIAAGRPVIVEVNPAGVSTAQHWVVVTGYTGGDPSSPASYYCADPWKTDLGTYLLTQATNYSNVYRYLYYS